MENCTREQRRCSLYSLESKKKRKNSSNSIYKIHSTRRLSRFTVRVFLNTRRKSRRDRFEIAFKAHKELFSTVSFDRSRSTREAKEEKEEERNVYFSFFREATLSNRVMPPRHSSPRFTRSLPRSRPPDSSVSIERTWLAERIRCAYVCARARARAPSCDHETAEEGWRNAGPSE